MILLVDTDNMPTHVESNIIMGRYAMIRADAFGKPCFKPKAFLVSMQKQKSVLHRDVIDVY